MHKWEKCLDWNRGTSQFDDNDQEKQTQDDTDEKFSCLSRGCKAFKDVDVEKN